VTGTGPARGGRRLVQYGVVPRWTCPRCDREFGRAHQSHTCVPGCTVDATFAGCPPGLRGVYDAIVAHLLGLGPVHEDAVGVGVFLKRDRKLAEVRPRSRDVSLALYLPRHVADPRFSRVLGRGSPRVIHVVLLREAQDVDEQVRGWLAEAFLHASD
jgi:Domain of unknown function (DUF5655)